MSSDISTRAFLQTLTSAPQNLRRILTYKRGAELSLSWNPSATPHGGGMLCLLPSPQPPGMLACHAQLSKNKNNLSCACILSPQLSCKLLRGRPRPQQRDVTGAELQKRPWPAFPCMAPRALIQGLAPGGQPGVARKCLCPLSQQRPVCTRHWLDDGDNAMWSPCPWCWSLGGSNDGVGLGDKVVRGGQRPRRAAARGLAGPGSSLPGRRRS